MAKTELFASSSKNFIFLITQNKDKLLGGYYGQSIYLLESEATPNIVYRIYGRKYVKVIQLFSIIISNCTWLDDIS